MSLIEVREFLFWTMLLNVGLLTLSSITIIVSRPFVCKLHGKFFCLSEEQISILLYTYLAIYKVIVISFNIVPWLALAIII